MLTPPQKPSVPLGMNETPFDPQTGRYEALEDIREVRVFRVIDEYDDYLKCEDWNGQVTYVAKPFLLRKTAFDGRTIDEEKYEYSDAQTRTVDGNTENLTPPYIMDEEFITAVRFKGGIWSPVPISVGAPDEVTCKPMASPGGRRIIWEDINGAGRTWISTSTMLWAKAQAAHSLAVGNGSKVSCKAVTDRTGAGEDGEAFDVYLPRTAASDPNVQPGEVIGYVIDGAGDKVCVTEVGDDPIGSIKSWRGAVATIRAGWQLCADLADRFVVGATGDAGSGGARDAGTSGGSHNTAAHALADHPAHRHGLDMAADNGAVNDISGDLPWRTDQLAAQAHTWTNNHTNNGDNMPKWYALAYIERVA